MALVSTNVNAKLLVVDDDDLVRGWLIEALEAEGFALDGVNSAEEAMSRLQSGGWALVLTDLHLPGLSGMELLARIRRDWPHIAVVMMTGAGDLRNGIAAMQSGAEDYLAKPIQFDLLKASLMRALDHRRLAAELDLYHRRLEVMVAERTRETREVFARMEQVYEETLAVLSAALDLRDTETAGHSRRVAAYALRLAGSLGCSEEIRDNLLRASYLHDIGKMGIADAILLKPAALTTAERDIMQSHVQIGYEMVRHFSFLAPVAEIVHSHHERWDGLGYPRGLAGAAILLEARIFSVADMLDAVTSDRPYRAAQPFSMAFDEARRHSGKQFDPAVIAGLLRVPEDEWEKLRREVESTTGTHRLSRRDLRLTARA